MRIYDNIRTLVMRGMLLIALPILAQDSVPIPTFNAQPYFFASGTLLEAEYEQGVADTKVAALGMGSASTSWAVFGERSTVRFPVDSVPMIIIRYDPSLLMGIQINPNDALSISKGTISTPRRSEPRRLFTIASISAGARAQDISNSRIDFSVRPLNDHIYQIIPKADLQPGEYAIIYSGNRLACFGIDGN